MLTSAQNYLWWVQLRIQSFNTTVYHYAAPKSLEINGRNALYLLRIEIALNLKSKPKILFSHLSSFLWVGCASTECYKCTKHNIMKVLTTGQLALGCLTMSSCNIKTDVNLQNDNFILLGPNLPKSQIPYMTVVCVCGGGGGGGGVQDQLPTFDVQYKSAKIPNSLYSGWSGGPRPTFDAQSKSDKIPNSLYGGGEGLQDHLPTFDAESKSAIIPNSLRGGGSGTNFLCWVQIW